MLLFFIIICYFCRRFIPYSGLFILSSLLAMLALMAPMVNFVASVTLSSFLILFSLPFVDNYTALRSELAARLWAFLMDLGIIYYLLNIYYNFFVLNSQKIFRIKTLFIFANILGYLILSKYLFLIHGHIEHLNSIMYFLLYFGLTLGIIMVNIRVMLSLAMITHALYPIYVVNFDELEPSTKELDSANKPLLNKPIANKTFALFNKTNNHNYHQNNNSSNSVFFKRVSIITALAGVGIASYAAYQQQIQSKAAIIQAEAAVIQAHAAVEQNRLFECQNDLEKVSQGLMTKEAFNKKYPE